MMHRKTNKFVDKKIWREVILNKQMCKLEIDEFMKNKW